MNDERALSPSPEDIEELAMALIRKPTSSQMERRAGVAVLRELSAVLLPHEKRVTELFLLLRDRLHDPADVRALVELLWSLPIPSAPRASSLHRLLERAFDSNFLDTAKWIVESGLLPRPTLKPEWRALAAPLSFPARFALVLDDEFLEEKRDLKANLKGIISEFALRNDPALLERATDCNLVFVLTSGSSTLTTALIGKFQSRGAIVIHLQWPTGRMMELLSKAEIRRLRAGKRSKPERSLENASYFTVRNGWRSDPSPLEFIESLASHLFIDSEISIDWPRMREILHQGGCLNLAVGKAQTALTAVKFALDKLRTHAACLHEGSHILLRLSSSSPITEDDLEDATHAIRARLGDLPQIIITTGRHYSIEPSARASILATDIQEDKRPVMRCGGVFIHDPALRKEEWPLLLLGEGNKD